MVAIFLCFFPTFVLGCKCVWTLVYNNDLLKVPPLFQIDVLFIILDGSLGIFAGAD